MLASNSTPSASPAVLTDGSAHLFIFACSAVGILFSMVQFYFVSQIGKSELGDESRSSPSINSSLLARSRQDLRFIYETIRDGAKAFLWAEYKICFLFIVLFGLLVLIMVAHPWAAEAKWTEGILTAVSFAVGGLTSIVSGYIGMMVAVYSNARTALEAQRGATDDAAEGWTASFNAAFRAGSVMGFSLCGLSLGTLYILCLMYKGAFADFLDDAGQAQALFECIAGYGLGGSSIAMFGRVGGGIFTKAADVGADLAGKVIGVGEGKKLDEDSPYNPACIADNVGDNVGDVAGMGSDLFGSFGEASCAALLVGASCSEIRSEWVYLMFPLYISAVGIIVCMVCSFVATNLSPVKKEADVETVLKVQLVLTSVFVSVAMYFVCVGYLPENMTIGDDISFTPMSCFACVLIGLWGGCIIGFITEYFTSSTYQPVRDVARSTETGAATNIIYGLALGYKSAIVPVMIISVIIYVGFKSAGMYGVSLSALGMLSTLATCLSIDVFGPVCDNAGGVAEMCELPERVRNKTDALDAAGNTTAAIGKGFAIGSAALVSLALFGAFITRVFTFYHVTPGYTYVGAEQVNLLKPIVFAFLLYGAMVPYWFSALTMRSVGEAANAMVKEVARQWVEVEGLKDIAGLDFEARNEEQDKRERDGRGRVRPEYAKCIKIATDASLREMIAPGCLVIFTPIITGVVFGWAAVAGLLAGALVSSVQLAISMSNTGGAWDNAKKYTEKGELNGWFKHGTNSSSPAAFDKAAAAGNTGNAAFSNLTLPVESGKAGQKSDGSVKGLKAFLEHYEKTDAIAYRKIMEGQIPIQSNDGRMCLYAGKRSEAHSASVVGDTVGDPLKDTSGPALNIVMKLMAIISVVFSSAFLSINEGNGLLSIEYFKKK
jgi:inorganic pyrophosphatase